MTDRAGKGTGNFLEDEKVASPQLDSRPSTVLRPFDGVYPELSRTGSGRASGEEKVRHTVGKRYPGDYREIPFGTKFNVAKVNGAKL